jgi:hypothetical protein
MGERRSLIDGLVATPPASSLERERSFVDAGEPAPQAAAAKPANVAQNTQRAPITTRIREDYAKALKRASLERQLAGIAPNTLQDILEEAIEPWLRTNGYLNQ